MPGMEWNRPSLRDCREEPGSRGDTVKERGEGGVRERRPTSQQSLRTLCSVCLKPSDGSKFPFHPPPSQADLPMSGQRGMNHRDRQWRQEGAWEPSWGLRAQTRADVHQGACGECSWAAVGERGQA